MMRSQTARVLLALIAGLIGGAAVASWSGPGGKALVTLLEPIGTGRGTGASALGTSMCSTAMSYSGLAPTSDAG